MQELIYIEWEYFSIGLVEFMLSPHVKLSIMRNRIKMLYPRNDIESR